MRWSIKIITDVFLRAIKYSNVLLPLCLDALEVYYITLMENIQIDTKLHEIMIMLAGGY